MFEPIADWSFMIFRGQFKVIIFNVTMDCAAIINVFHLFACYVSVNLVLKKAFIVKPAHFSFVQDNPEIMHSYFQYCCIIT